MFSHAEAKAIQKQSSNGWKQISRQFTRESAKMSVELENTCNMLEKNWTSHLISYLTQNSKLLNQEENSKNKLILLVP